MSVKTIESMLNWIEENIKNEPSLEDMAAYVGYSMFYCSSKFHECIGMTFKEYIAKRKLSLAAIEMKSTNHRLIDIAVAYGFSSHEAFTRAFVKNYGITPCRYRKDSFDIKLFNKAKVVL